MDNIKDWLNIKKVDKRRGLVARAFTANR